LKDKIRELESKIRELESELRKKDQEIEQLEDINEELEDTILKFESFTPEEGTKKKSKKIQAAQSRFAYELEEKDKEIRDLKNRMGFLRKDYTQLREEFDWFKTTMKESSVIRVEELREKPPLNSLVAELQEKVNKQRSTINNLEFQLKEIAEFDEKLKEKDVTIEAYITEINELNQKLNEMSSVSESETRDSIAKKLIEDLQKQLNKAKRQIIELKQKLTKYDKKSKKPDKNSETLEIKELKDKLMFKDKEIDQLKESMTSLQVAGNSKGDGSSGDMMITLKEDLQNQLNKAKLQIKSLQDQLKKGAVEVSSETSELQKDVDGKLKMQREMAILLQKQLDTKDDEIKTIKNEAVQIKKRYRQLENQVKLRDLKISDLQKQLETQSIQKPTRIQDDPQLLLRLRELKGVIEDLKKQNIEQRMEIAELRNK
jgi:chromosome segregation ATPase